MQNIERKWVWAMRFAAVVAVVFGAATVMSGGNVLFGSGAAAAGNIITFIVWFNFLAGFAYIAAGAGLWKFRPWSAWLSLVLAAANALAFAVLAGYIMAGAEYESRTVAAMTLRMVLWIAIAAQAWWVVHGVEHDFRK